MNFLIKLRSLFSGDLIGKDHFGNRYYRQHHYKGHWQNEPRWVVYKGLQHASKIPALWYSWLHHTVEFPTIRDKKKHAWEKPHLPSLTGTPHAFNPTEMPSIRKYKAPYKRWEPSKGNQ